MEGLKKKDLYKQGYRFVGNHSAIKVEDLVSSTTKS